MLASAWGGTQLLCPVGSCMRLTAGGDHERHSVGSSVRNCLPRNCKTSHGPQRALYGGPVVCKNCRFSFRAKSSVLFCSLERVAVQTSLCRSSIKRDKMLMLSGTWILKTGFFMGALARL
jgi:hypothetical protein